MNQLEHKDEFRKALAKLTLSSSGQKALQEVRLALLVAPTASGRNTIINELLKTDKYHFIITDTTRQPRVNNGVLEQNGREYWFRQEDEMLDDILKGEFVEAAIIHDQQVSGISVRELVAAAKEGKVAITDTEPVGAGNIHRLKPDTTMLFMVPPSFAIWQQRMHARGQMPPEEVRRRLQSAKNELDMALESDYYNFVINQDIQETAREIDRLIITGQYDPAQSRLARAVAEEIHKDVEAYLKQST